MLTRVERINPYLNVGDLGASVKFYVNVLGFGLYVETPNLAIIQRDGHQIHLITIPEEHSPHRVWLGVEDISVLYDQYKQRDTKFIQEPTNFSWAYQMIIEDLDGNKLIYGSDPIPDEPYQDE